MPIFARRKVLRMSQFKVGAVVMLRALYAATLGFEDIAAPAMCISARYLEKISEDHSASRAAGVSIASLESTSRIALYGL